MTPELSSALESLGLTGREFCALTGINANTLSGWGKPRSGRGVQEVPRWVWLLLAAWAAAPDVLAEMRAQRAAA